MPSKDYTTTELANLAICENQHKLRFMPVATNAQMQTGTRAHEKFLEGQHIRKKEHDPDALFSFMNSLLRLFGTIVSAFLKLPFLAKGLLIFLAIVAINDIPWLFPLLAAGALPLWIRCDKDNIKKDIGRRKWSKHPLRRLAEEKLKAKLIYIEGRFQGEFRQFNRFQDAGGRVVLFGWFPNQSRLRGRPDLIVKDASGNLVPVDCKVRKTHDISERDIVQLSCYRYIMTTNKRIFGRETVADYGYIVFLNKAGFPEAVKQTNLHSNELIDRLADRAIAIDYGEEPRETSNSSALCRKCLVGEHCATNVYQEAKTPRRELAGCS